MRPPICALCHRDFRREASTGGLVHFRDEKPLPDGMTGHPRGVEWFCSRHLAAAQKLSPLSFAEAMAKLRRRYLWRVLFGSWWRRIFRHGKA